MSDVASVSAAQSLSVPWNVGVVSKIQLLVSHQHIGSSTVVIDTYTYRIYSVLYLIKKPEIHTYNIKNLIFIQSYKRINQKQEAIAVYKMILDFYEEYIVVKDDQDPYQEMVQDEEAIDVANETIIPTEDRMSVSLYLAGEIIR